MSTNLRNCLHPLAVALCGAALCFSSLPDAFAQDSAQQFIDAGNGLYNTKKYSEAVQSYIKAIQLEPKTAVKAYLNCARAYTMLNEYTSAQHMYDNYYAVTGDQKDKKIAAEYKAVTRKIKKGEAYARPESQNRVLAQLQDAIRSGTYINAQGGGAFAYYDVLLRTGYAETDLLAIQEKLVKGLIAETESDIMPIEGQPLPGLDRVGWERIRNKIARAGEFPNVTPDQSRIDRITNASLGWDAYFKSEYDKAVQYFDLATSNKDAMPVVFWGRMMAAFHTDSDEQILARIDRTEMVYNNAKLGKFDAYFALLRAQVYRSMGKIDEAMKQLEIMNAAF